MKADQAPTPKVGVSRISILRVELQQVGLQGLPFLLSDTYSTSARSQVGYDSVVLCPQIRGIS